MDCSTRTSSKLLEAAGEPARPRQSIVLGLTPREIEVLRSLARGRTVREIAQHLVIAPKTAHNHVQHIYAKLGVTTRAAATMVAMQHGLAGRPAAITDADRKIPRDK